MGRFDGRRGDLPALLNYPAGPPGRLRVMRLAPGIRRAQLIFQFGGVALLAMVGLAFIFVRGFHRPLLELISLGSAEVIRMEVLFALQLRGPWNASLLSFVYPL